MTTRFFVAATAGPALVAVALSFAAHAETYQWTTLAGNTGGYGATDGPVAAAHFTYPSSIASDAENNLYVADSGSSIIRRIAPNGVVATLAGTANREGSTDGPGSVALLNRCSGVAADALGNVFVADTNNHTIRKIDLDGLVSTLAGRAGQSGVSDGLGPAARFKSPADLAVDGDGNVYVADSGNETIRKITPAGRVSTLAGSPGNQGSVDGTGTLATFHGPHGVAVDAGGVIYVADTFNHTIRKVTPAGGVSTIAGTAGAYGIADGSRNVARLGHPRGLKLDGSGNLYVAEWNAQTIRKVTLTGTVTTLAGRAETAGYANGLGANARFEDPLSVALDNAGNLYVADSVNHAIRKITPAKQVSTLAGGPLVKGSANGTGTAARFNQPAGLCVDAGDNVYVADTQNHTIRKITPTGMVTTLAGTPLVTGTADGAGTVAKFNEPSGIAVDSAGNLLVADHQNHTIRKITPSRVVSTFLGSPGESGSADGTGAAAQLYSPFGVAVDGAGTVYVPAAFHHLIRRATPTGSIAAFAGGAGQPGFVDGTAGAARFSFPRGVTANAAGDVYVTDTNNRTIRKITRNAVVTTLAGEVATSGHADGLGAAARFSDPVAIAVDGRGHLYVADEANALIRKVTPAGLVTTIGGLVGSRLIGDGPGSVARFNAPRGIACTPSGVVYVADSENHRIVRGTIIPPAATAQALTLVEDTPESITLTGTDIDGDSLSFLVVTPPVHGTLTGAAPNLVYTPAADYSGEDSFTFMANDGSIDSAPATVALYVTAVNDPPTFTTPLPGIDAGMAALDVELDLLPLMRDPDEGDTHAWRIAAVSDPSIFAVLAVTAGRLDISYALYRSGASSVTVEVRDRDGTVDEVTFLVTLPALPVPEVTAAGALNLNPETGLVEQSVTLTNSAQRAISGFQLTVSGLPADAALYNGSDGLGSGPMVEYYRPLAPGESVAMILEYYSPVPNMAWQPRFTPSVAPSYDSPTSVAGRLAVDRVLVLDDKAILIEFGSIPGHLYSLQFSGDGTHWRDSAVPLRAAGTLVQWIDRGPPRTDTPPAQVASRLYRVKEATP